MKISFREYKNLNFINHKKNSKTWNSLWENLITKYHNKNSKKFFDNCIDRSFNPRLRDIPNGVHNNFWIGYLHHVFNIDKSSSYYIHSANNIFTSYFLSSYKNCKGLIVSSEYLKKSLFENLTKNNLLPVSIDVIPYVLEIKNIKYFDFKKYKETPQIVFVGNCFRNYVNFYKFETNVKKIILSANELYIKEQLQIENLINLYDSVLTFPWQTFEEYEKIITSSIIFLDYLDTTSNTILLECIKRKIPIIIKKHPATVEYLGEKYPLYFNNINDLNKINLNEKIISAIEYLNLEELQYKNSFIILED